MLSHANTLEVVANTDADKVFSNIKKACALDLPWLEVKDTHDKQAVIVGGGPSLEDTISEVVQRHAMGQTIIALNNCAHYLVQYGITPDWQIILDPRPENDAFVIPPMSSKYWIASQCDERVFKALKGRDVTVFHMKTHGIEDIIPKDRVANLISSGTTVGLAAMAIAYTQGYKAIHLHGMDSSFREDQHHVYRQDQNDKDKVIELICGGRTFKSCNWMVMQAHQFQIIAAELVNDFGITITVAGDSLLSHLARLMMNPQPQKKDGEGISVVFMWQGESSSQYPTLPRAKRMVESVRKHMPKAKLVQLSSETFPVCPGVDQVVRIPAKKDLVEFGYEVLEKFLKTTNDDVLCIATDVVLQQDVSGVFAIDFDIASCRYPKRTRPDHSYCVDVTFLKNATAAAFIGDTLKYYRDHPIIQDGWEGGQTAFANVAVKGPYCVYDLDFDTYCRTPESEDEDVSDAAIVHYRGPRKKWMVKQEAA